MMSKHALKLFDSATRKEKIAVAGLTFGVKRGECFGLLGVNGAVCFVNQQS